MTPTPKPKKRHPELFLNRELSWLEFNGRVLEEATDPANPLLERLKFAAITASNLDEFFMVRVAGLKQAVLEGDTGPDHAGLTPGQQIAAISERAHRMVESLYATLMGEILPALGQRGIRIERFEALDPAQKASVGRWFQEEVLPALTPLAIDSSRPFPMLANLSLNLALLLEPVEGSEEPRLAVVQVPGRFPRLVRPIAGDGNTFTWLEEIISSDLAALFPGQKILESAAFRIARDSELDLDDEGGRDLLMEVEGELRKRRGSRVVRLEVEARNSEALLGRLGSSLEVGPE